MKSATVTEVKNGLSAFLDQVKAGETVIVTDRGRPIARLEPITASGEPTGRVERLARSGVVRPGTGEVPRALLRGPMAGSATGRSVVDALIDERRSGR